MGDDQPSDAELLLAIGVRDHAAFAVFYSRHQLRAFYLARRILDDQETAAEIVQEVFLQIWQRATMFDPARGAAQTWLLASVHHAAISRTRGRWGRERHAIALDEHLWLRAPGDPAADAEAAERASWLHAGLATLPTAQREAIELHYFGGLTCVELAAQTATGTNTVKGRLRRAREQLRVTLAPLAVRPE